MIQVLGYKRVLTLAILLGVNIALAVALYYLILPDKDRTERELRAVTTAVAARRAETETLRTEYQQVQEQKALFGELQNAGFFNAQDRVEARKMIEAIQSSSHVLSAKYAIRAAEVVENPTAAAANHVVLKSPITFTIEALDDIDVYSFIYWLENALPGHASVERLSIERTREVDEVSLRQIGNGVPTVMVVATIDMSWRTLVPREQAITQFGQPSATPQ